MTKNKTITKVNENELKNGILNFKGSCHNKYNESCWVYVGGLRYKYSEAFIQQSIDIKTDEIGRGKFGIVYKLKESVTGRQFAMKNVQNETEGGKLKNIENYINICLKKLEHENIVKYFGAVTEGSSKELYIFMEYEEGESLQKYMEKNKIIPKDKILWFTKQILEGVSFLHCLRIVHGDINPNNILLDDKENIKLSDFGLSRFLQPSDKFLEDPSGPLAPLIKEYIKNPLPEILLEIQVAISYINEFKTVTNYAESKATINCANVLGTLGYIAPEIRKNESHGLAVDIWSVGATMFHLLEGKPPGSFKNKFSIEKCGFVYDLMNEMGNENPADRPTAKLLLKKIEERQTDKF